MLPDPNDRPTRQGRAPVPLRGITVAIAVIALALFGGLIGYTYFSRGGGPGGPVPLIKADPRPMKMAPEKPGGMEVPNQDKEIYARIDRNLPPAQGQAPRVERLLPPPESPMPRPRPPSAPAPLEPEIPAAPALEPPPNAVEVPQPAPAAPPRAAAPAPAKPAAPSPATPAPQQQASAPRAATPAPPTAPPAATGATRYRIQLAALRTNEDATREWDKLRRAHMDLLGPLALSVVRADLGDRGTFYRIQAGPLADEQAAKELCRRLVEKKVGCLVVRP